MKDRECLETIMAIYNHIIPKMESFNNEIVPVAKKFLSQLEELHELEDADILNTIIKYNVHFPDISAFSKADRSLCKALTKEYIFAHNIDFALNPSDVFECLDRTDSL